MSEANLSNKSSRCNYQEYMKSPAWAGKRAAALIRAGHACQLCKGKKKLSVHHNTYARLGHEDNADLVVLCEKCHTVFHINCDPPTAHKMRSRGINAPPKISALPNPPMVIEQEFRGPPPKIFSPPSMGANGRIISVTVTREYRDKLIGPTGGITLRALRLLGEDTVRTSGWKERCIGNTVLIDEGDLLAEQKVVEDKHNGIWPPKGPKPKRRPKINLRNERGFNAEEVKNIRACSRMGVAYRKIAHRYKCSRELISRVAKGSDFKITEPSPPLPREWRVSNAATGELSSL